MARWFNALGYPVGKTPVPAAAFGFVFLSDAWLERLNRCASGRAQKACDGFGVWSHRQDWLGTIQRLDLTSPATLAAAARGRQPSCPCAGGSLQAKCVLGVAIRSL